MDLHYRFDQDNTPATCPGGKDFTDCETSAKTLRGARDFLAVTDLLDVPETTRSNRLIYLTLGCVSCSLNCAVSLEIDGAKTTATLLDYEGPGRSLGVES